VVVGGSRQRQDRREDRRNADATAQAQSSASQAYANCMSGRGYSVTP
jgi:hypothetical protein